MAVETHELSVKTEGNAQVINGTTFSSTIEYLTTSVMTHDLLHWSNESKLKCSASRLNLEKTALRTFKYRFEVNGFRPPTPI